MIVTAALAWWNESPHVLERCIRSMAGIADRVVALDGAYRRYPGATETSSDDQVDAIRDTAAAHNLDCLILQPRRLWAGQVEKRSYLMGAAQYGSDWIAVMDADWELIVENREVCRRRLETTTCDVVETRFVTPPNTGKPLPHAWHAEMSGTNIWLPMIFRALPGIHLINRHWCYAAYKDGKKVWLYTCGEGLPSVPHDAMMEPYQVIHHSFERTEEEVRASRAFLNDRAKIVALTGQEDHQPGLFEPEFDYVTVTAG